MSRTNKNNKMNALRNKISKILLISSLAFILLDQYILLLTGENTLSLTKAFIDPSSIKISEGKGINTLNPDSWQEHQLFLNNEDKFGSISPKTSLRPLPSKEEAWSNVTHPRLASGMTQLKPGVLDFMIVGFAKCGTSTMVSKESYE